MVTRYNPFTYLCINLISLLIAFTLSSNIEDFLPRVIFILSCTSLALSIYFYTVIVSNRFSISIIFTNLLLIPWYFIIQFFLCIPMIPYNIYRLIISIPKNEVDRKNQKQAREFIKLARPLKIQENDLANCYAEELIDNLKCYLYGITRLSGKVKMLKAKEKNQILKSIKNDEESIRYYELMLKCSDIIKQNYTESGLLKSKVEKL